MEYVLEISEMLNQIVLFPLPSQDAKSRYHPIPGLHVINTSLFSSLDKGWISYSDSVLTGSFCMCLEFKDNYLTT